MEMRIAVGLDETEGDVALGSWGRGGGVSAEIRRGPPEVGSSLGRRTA